MGVFKFQSRALYWNIKYLCYQRKWVFKTIIKNLPNWDATTFLIHFNLLWSLRLPRNAKWLIMSYFEYLKFFQSRQFSGVFFILRIIIRKCSGYKLSLMAELKCNFQVLNIWILVSLGKKMQHVNSIFNIHKNTSLHIHNSCQQLKYIS